MESIIRCNGDHHVSLADFYNNIKVGRGCPDYYRNVNLLAGQEKNNDYLIMDTLGRGRMGYVFLAYHEKKLSALKMSYERQEETDIFSTLKKAIGDDFKDYFLIPVGKVFKIDTFYLGSTNQEKKYLFDKDVYVSFWEPADSTLLEKLNEPFETKLIWFYQFLKGLKEIHSRNRAHFDIKLDNLFIVGNHLKIGDFEFYLKIDDFKHSDILLCGTPGHIAPEMFYDRENITPKVDIFSGGIAFSKLFTGQTYQKGKDLTLFELQEMARLFKNINAEEYFNDKDFQLNFKIYQYYRNQLDNHLNNGKLPENESSIFQLLRRMIETYPVKRPVVNEIVPEIEAILKVPASEVYVANSLANIIKTHEKRDVIKYCLIPDLIERLEYDGIKVKIMGIRFNGNAYDKKFFSFITSDEESKILLFGKKISSGMFKNNKKWNLILIVDFWNRCFSQGLEKVCDKKYIGSILDWEKLDGMVKDLFRPKIKVTQKKIITVWKIIKEI